MTRSLLTAGLVAGLAMGPAGAGASPEDSGPAVEPVRLVVAGLSHTHVHWIFESAKRESTFEIVGIAETDHDLARRYAAQHGFDPALVHDELGPLLDQVRPEGVTAFGPIDEHLDVVRAAAPRGIHVMVEKPLAVSLAAAREMAALAERHDIHLLTNYETTWYPSNHLAARRLGEGGLGPLRKAVFHHGHEGPVKLGINDEFLVWLTDPARNGAGALTDFGCYGANLMTWFTQGERPLAVTAVTRQFQPDLYPDVDDEATIIVDYENVQAIIQASWNWPVARKDAELYGEQGQLFLPSRDAARFTTPDGTTSDLALPVLDPPRHDPFTWFAAVIRGAVTPDEWDPSGTANNLRVMEILQAAMDSAARGETVPLEAP